ncbi:MAG: CmcJ/NvfI family oxidoreductase [Alphaproteobacteria bacterium]
MDQIKDTENHVEAVVETDLPVADSAAATPSAYVPPLQLTEGQSPPIAANGGLSYMSFDRNGDAGVAAAMEAAFIQIAEGKGQAVIDMLDNAPPGPIETQWGVGFRGYDECMDHIRANNIEAPEGGLALPLPYSINEQPSYNVVASNALWRDPGREANAKALRKDEQDNARRRLYFPQVMRDARRIGEYYPGLSPNSAECMDKLGVSLAHCESDCENFYDSAEVERVFYPEIEKLLLEFFPGATDALVYNHDVFDKDYQGDRTEDQDNKNPGVNANYANLVHNDLNDNSGRVRCRELLTKNLRNFGREQNYTEAQADAKMSRRFMSINLAKPMETVRQNPFVLCAWPSFADQPYINNYRIYDDRVGETTRFTYRAGHEWYWLPEQTPTEVSMLKCYDSVTDGSVSRWSFHTASVDPTAPDDAPCRKNVVVRSYVFF